MEDITGPKTKWDLTKFYRSEDDPNIERDIKEYKRLFDIFSKKYRLAKFANSEDSLLESLIDYESLIDRMEGGRPLLYFYYLNALDSTNPKYQAQIARITNILTSANNKITFYPLELGRIKKQNQKKYLISPKLARYRYFLKRRFILAKYDLTEPEENILNLKNLTSYTLWTQGLQKALNKRTVNFDGKKMPLSEAANLYPMLTTQKRRNLYKKVIQEYFAVSDFAEAEINAIVNDHKINDKLRKIKKPYLQRVLSAENNIEVVEDLIESVTEKFTVSKDFYKIKAKLLKLDKLKYADRAAKIKHIGIEYSYQKTAKIVTEIIGGYDSELKKICEEIVTGGQVDVYPKKGKTGGAFCSSSHKNPTLILLNHTNDFKSVLTFAHEMGHAIHSELAKSQPPLYEEYSLSTAETASTFFETIVFEKLVEDLPKDQKIIALHDKIQQQVNSVFRQIACFNFELDLHTQIRERGALSKQEIARLMNRHMKNYLGSKFELSDLDGYFFVAWSHIRSYFYVYTYAYGQLISNVLTSIVRKNPSEIKKAIKFMKAGGSETPENIFKSIGIDLNKSFWKTGIEQIKRDLDELEKLLN